MRIKKEALQQAEDKRLLAIEKRVARKLRDIKDESKKEKLRAKLIAEEEKKHQKKIADRVGKPRLTGNYSLEVISEQFLKETVKKLEARGYRAVINEYNSLPDYIAITPGKKLYCFNRISPKWVGEIEIIRTGLPTHPIRDKLHHTSNRTHTGWSIVQIDDDGTETIHDNITHLIDANERVNNKCKIYGAISQKTKVYGSYWRYATKEDSINLKQ